jgi:hypothetical protein
MTAPLVVFVVLPLVALCIVLSACASQGCARDETKSAHLDDPEWWEYLRQCAEKKRQRELTTARWISLLVFGLISASGFVFAAASVPDVRIAGCCAAFGLGVAAIARHTWRLGRAL